MRSSSWRVSPSWRPAFDLQRDRPDEIASSVASEARNTGELKGAAKRAHNIFGGRSGWEAIKSCSERWKGDEQRYRKGLGRNRRVHKCRAEISRRCCISY
ncbi:hypothetical protein ILYODFUR_030075 [Ilyodon furcidens]|uniref:Uncharacterized protein n=1 Tax=Ilyodon furcidens TaxID=33524 RepID=A0ABV0U9N7_9TELE